MSIGKTTLVILIIVCLVGLLGCPSEQEESVEETPRQETVPQPETTPGVNQPDDNKTTLQENLQNQYSELEQNIENLQNQAEEISDESKEEFNQMMQSLDQQKNIVEERLEALGTASNEGWETVKNSTEEALNNLQNIYNQMASRFSQGQ
jgi:hypothetical protein